MDVARALARLGIEVAEERRGELWCLCPYHEDRRPSWSIRARRDSRHGLHKCMSCGAGGDLAGLVAYKLGFREDWDDGAARAREWLAGEEELEPKEELKARFEVESADGSAPFRLPEGVRVEPVAEWDERARLYLLEERGIPAAQAERWGLGWAREGRLRGRLVVPVRDGRGRIASYMARACGTAERRYLYPRREEGADHDVMFGQQWWPRQRAERGTCWVAEGAFKSMALERATGDSIGALGGSEVRAAHAVALATFDRVVYVRDGGEAGEKAWQSVRASLARHVELLQVSLPDREDADSLAKKDPGELARRLASAEP